MVHQCIKPSRTLIAISAVAVLLSIGGFAQQRAINTDYELVAEVTSIVEGESFDVALHLDPDPGWHVYWINAGDNGFPPRIRWDLPEGFVAGDLQYKTPEFIPFQQYVSYGYNGSTYFLSTITAPDKISDNVTLNARVSWLACDDELCIPESGEVSLTLPRGDSTAYSEHRAQFVLTRNEHPVTVPWEATFTSNDEEVVIDVNLPADLTGIQDVWFFPASTDLIDHAVAQQISSTPGSLRIATIAGSNHTSYDQISGVLKTASDTNGNSLSYAITAKRVDSMSATQFASTKSRLPLEFGNSSHGGTTDSGTVASTGEFSASEFLQYLLFAFFGGLILNIMPCVLPILSLKALSVAEMASDDARGVRIAGLSYTAGVVLCFLALVGVLLILRASGAALGWGFQLQNPITITLMAMLLVVVGFNFSGLFEIQGSFANLGGLTQRLTSMRGTGDFFTGLLAVIIASPCTVPFMSVASGYALLQSTPVALGVFTGLAIGFASPYLLITFFPFLRNLLPKPGAWMETFRKILAFPMYGTALWLLWVLGSLTDNTTVTMTLAMMLVLAFVFWAWTRARETSQLRWNITSLASALIVVGIAWSLWTATEVELVEEFAWSETAVEEFHAQDKPIFAYFTADWCVSCKVNEAVALHRPRVQEYFADNEVVVLVGDWTAMDDEIARELERHDRVGVPLYLYYKPGGDINQPVVLPAALTPSVVLNAIEDA